MFSLYFVNAFQVSITGGLTPFITSEFQNHSLLTVINIVANSMAAAVYIPLAKILDIWGRAEGFLLMTCFATLGLILMAVSHNLPTFCAAQVGVLISGNGLEKQSANGPPAGFLYRRIWRHDLQYRCHHRRCVQVEEPRSGLRLYVLPLHDHGFRWSQGCGGFLHQVQLAMGIWLLCHCPARRCLGLIHPAQAQPSQGPEAGHSDGGEERPWRV